MTNNRLKIVNKRRKRKTINNIALIIVIIGIFILSVLFLKNNYLEKDNTIHEIVSATTTSTTTTVETTTVSTTTEVINNTYAKNFVYSFTVVDDKYKILICNKDSYARLSTYNLYYNNKLIERLEQRMSHAEEKIDFFVRTALPPVEDVFYDGQIFDAYTFVSDLIQPVAIDEFQNAHDRFLCIDDTVYHIGASLKDLGKKWFAFSKMEINADALQARM